MASRKPLGPLAKPLPTGLSKKGGDATASGPFISPSSFAFLYAEMVSYHMARVGSMGDLEARLDDTGYGIGLRLLELVFFKDRPGRRETGVLPALQFVASTLWSHLFGKTADALERSTEQANSYMIREAEPLTNAFISVPRDRSRFNPASFIAGIIRGVLDGSGFPCTVQAATVPAPDAPLVPGAAPGPAPRDKTVFVIKFEAEA